MTGTTDQGLALLVAGPDGSGKTTVTDRLAEDVFAGRKVLRLHHRPRVLPARTTHSGPVTEPHAHPPYSRWLSEVKVLYLFLDYALGWRLRVRPFLRSGGVVLLERGWLDLAVDPLRYRLHPGTRLARLVRSLLPQPDLAVVLEADPATLTGRKMELPPEELTRQAAVWRALGIGRPVEFVDATLPLDMVVARVEHLLCRATP